MVPASKLAPTDVAPSTVTVHVPVPEHAPVHPTKIEPGEAVAVSVTVVPAGSGIEQLSQSTAPVPPIGTVIEP